MVNRVGSVALLNSVMRDVSDVQGKLGNLQEQISGGIKARNFAGLSGQIEQFVLLESKIRSSQQYIESNQVGSARLHTTQQSVAQMVNLTDSMEDLIVQARNGASGADLNFDQLMGNLLTSMSGELNASFEGRFLFGGTNTQNAPVTDIFSTPVVPGQPDTAYYAGSTENLVYRADERIEYTFPARADDPAFQKIIAAAKSAIDAYAQQDSEALGAALTLMQQGQEELNTVQAKVNTAVVNLDQINDRLTSLKLYWQGLTEQVAKTDLVAASTEVASHEAILQATFQVYARLSQLRLSDYL